MRIERLPGEIQEVSCPSPHGRRWTRGGPHGNRGAPVMSDPMTEHAAGPRGSFPQTKAERLFPAALSYDETLRYLRATLSYPRAALHYPRTSLSYPIEALSHSRTTRKPFQRNTEPFQRNIELFHCNTELFQSNIDQSRVKTALRCFKISQRATQIAQQDPKPPLVPPGFPLRTSRMLLKQRHNCQWHPEDADGDAR